MKTPMVAVNRYLIPTNMATVYRDAYITTSISTCCASLKALLGLALAFKVMLALHFHPLACIITATNRTLKIFIFFFCICH